MSGKNVASFVTGELNQTIPEASLPLATAINSQAGGTPSGSTSFTPRLEGNWFIVGFDDFMRQDGTIDDYPDEANEHSTIAIHGNGSWQWDIGMSNSLIPASLISVQESQLSVTIEDFTGEGRTILTYVPASNSITGEYQLLVSDGVTYYNNYETWIMVKALLCSVTGQPYSFGGYMSAVEDCVAQIPFTTTDVSGQTFTFSAASGDSYLFNADNSGFMTDSNSEVTTFNWEIDRKGYLDIGFNTLLIRMRVALMGVNVETGDRHTKIYTEHDTLYSSDLIFEARADGEISEQVMVLVP